MAHIDDVTDRMRVTRKVIEFAEALAGEGFVADDITDAMFAAAYRRIGNYAEFLDWAKDVGRLELEYSRNG
jgi:hypothetical protein